MNRRNGSRNTKHDILTVRIRQAGPAGRTREESGDTIGICKHRFLIGSRSTPESYTVRRVETQKFSLTALSGDITGPLCDNPGKECLEIIRVHTFLPGMHSGRIHPRPDFSFTEYLPAAPRYLSQTSPDRTTARTGRVTPVHPKEFPPYGKPGNSHQHATPERIGGQQGEGLRYGYCRGFIFL